HALPNPLSRRRLRARRGEPEDRQAAPGSAAPEAPEPPRARRRQLWKGRAEPRVPRTARPRAARPARRFPDARGRGGEPHLPRPPAARPRPPLRRARHPARPLRVAPTRARRIRVSQHAAPRPSRRESPPDVDRMKKLTILAALVVVSGCSSKDTYNLAGTHK